MRSQRIILAILLGVALAMLALLHHYAPLQIGSVALYGGAILLLFGLLNLLKPFRLLSVPNRGRATLVAGCGILSMAAALLWPATTTRVAKRTCLLDDYMPEYEFREVHALLVRATPGEVKKAVHAVTFSEIGALRTLMRLRAAAAGKILPRQNALDRPVLDARPDPDSGFVALAQDENETVKGMVGRFWSSSPHPRLQSPAKFMTYAQSGTAKVAFNLRVEDAGAGLTRLVTETRVHAVDSTARAPLARYWRAIYPGSGIIRQMWLEAAKRRAEHGLHDDARAFAR